jgi:hemoglobin
MFLTRFTAMLDRVVPDRPYIAGVLAVVLGALLFALFWRYTDPAPIDRLPTLTAPVVLADRAAAQDAMAMAMAGGGGPGGHRRGEHRPVGAPLLIPLDVIPRDEAGKTPYDVVGAASIAAAVDQFYSKVRADPELADIFTDVNMAALKRHQALFIGQLWGGPVVMSLADLGAKHQPLQLGPERYWRVAAHLMVTLTHLNVPDWICVFTMTRLYQARNLIIVRERQT